MPLAFIVLLASAAPLLGGQATPPPSAPPPTQTEPVATFHGGVTLVKVDVQVTDRSGHIVNGLSGADFEVYDEGRPQKVAFFGHDAEPLDIVLLLDVSGSMRRSLQEMAAAARAALKPLGAGDRVAVMLFARNSAVREPLTGDVGAVQEEIRDAVNDQSLGSGTAINSAILTAAQYLGKEPPRGRRAILIVTDNMSLNYRLPDQEVVRQLYAADAVLNGILIGKHRSPDPVKPGTYANPDFTPSDIFKVAAESGGEAMASQRTAEAFQQMIERIRARYSLQYPAPGGDPGTFRHIRVELAPAARERYPHAVIRARAGYYAAP